MYIGKEINQRDNFLSEKFKEVYPDNLPAIDYNGFAQELNNLKKEINDNLGTDDIKHLKKIERWGKLCSLSGYATAWLIPNPVSALFISQGNITRWLMMSHHIIHKGYDKVPDIPEKYTSKKYGIGRRRFIDWFDWILPGAWNHSHNVLHHYHVGEPSDPDLVESSMETIRQAKIPAIFKLPLILFIICTWKIVYFTPSTLWLFNKSKIKSKKNIENSEQKDSSINKSLIFKSVGDFLFKALLPYFFTRFILIPALFLPLGKTSALFVLINSVLAEIIINIHSFMIVFPSHCGEDIYRYDKGITDQAEFYVRQVTGSVNYTCGNDFIDFFQSWLNYQIEHHIFPDIPMLKYQQYQPRIKTICEKYNVPYVQENIFKRFFKLLNIMVGKTDMKKTSTIPRNLRIKSE